MHSLLLGMGMTKFYLKNQNRTQLFGRLYQRVEKKTDIYSRKQGQRLLRSNPPIRKESPKDRWSCNKPFENDQEKVLDHCPCSGKFLGWAHSQGNL